MDNTYFSVMAPFFRLRNAEDTSMHDEDPRLETAKFRAKREQVVVAFGLPYTRARVFHVLTTE